MDDVDRWWPLEDRIDLRDRLLSAYDDPARGYHDRTHLREVLARLDELMEPDHPDRDAVLLAAWFHDAVYDGSAAAENEERSARLAEQELAGTKHAAEVARLVRLTARHDPQDDDRNGQLLCDADLAILAASPERYAQYRAGVRNEYSQIADTDFNRGRRAILQALLDKPTLFHTGTARARWEAAARANLEREIADLSG